MKNSLPPGNFNEYLLRVIDDYFTDRVLEYETDDCLEKYEVSARVPQGSVLGPILWNIMNYGVLNIKISEGTQTIGFADDLAVVATALRLDEAFPNIGKHLFIFL